MSLSDWIKAITAAMAAVPVDNKAWREWYERCLEDGIAYEPPRN